MSKNTELKSRVFIEKHGLDEKIQINEKGLFNLPDDLHESIVLADAGVTLEQLKKVQKTESELLAATALLAGEKTAVAFKENPELTETALSYSIGSTQTASIVFSRDNKDHMVAAVETKVKSAEFKRVASHLNSLFDDINS